MFEMLPRLSAALILVAAQPAHAALPAPVRAIIDAAIASGKADDVATVIKLAKLTNPGDEAEIDALLADFTVAKAMTDDATKAAEREQLKQAGFFDNWHGEGQIGASHSSGNSNSTGLSGGLALSRKGLHWTYKFRGRADYQRSNGQTTAEKFLVEVEPQYRISDRAFAFGLGRWERDRFQGYSARWTASGGLGYTLLDDESLSLDVNAGPAFRQTQLVGGGSSSQLSALTGLDFGWQLTPQLRLTEKASTLVGQGNMTISSLTAVSAKFSDKFSARLGYSVDIDTQPPPGARRTDTVSRFTLVYGF